MPCDTVQYTMLDASQMQTQHLRSALEAMGFQVRVESTNHLSFQDGRQLGQFQNGRLIVQPGFDEQRLKREYSGALVKAQAKAAGWRVKTVEEREEHNR